MSSRQAPSHAPPSGAHRSDRLDDIGADRLPTTPISSSPGTPDTNGVAGLEEERHLDPEDEPITQPFNPEKIKVTTTTILVDQVISRIRHREIDLNPDFQRLDVWKPTQRSRLIESILLRIPIPVFYVSADEYNNWTVVDGLQRMSTLRDFIKEHDGLVLKNLEYLQRFNDHGYSDLPRAMQRRIGETQFLVHVIEPGTPKDVMFNIFRRINTGGTALNKQELRHAVYAGPARDFLKRLAESQEFRRATDGSVSPMRMADRELVLRFLAFFMDPWEEYDAGDLDGHLGQAMDRLNRLTTEDRSNVEIVFRKSMNAAADIFGKDAFRKRFVPEDRRYGINRALFETWSVALARCSTPELQFLVEHREYIFDTFRALLNRDYAFVDAISYATGTAANVQRRFRTIEALIRGCL